MKKLVIVLGVIIVVMVLILLAAGSAEAPETGDDDGENAEVVTLVCPSGDDITITYQDEGEARAVLAVNGETYEVERTRTASGIRYANADETVVYREHQGSASVQVDNVMIYEDCREAGDDGSTKADGDTSATLVCADDETARIAYSGEENQNVTLSLPGVTYELTQAPTGSGIRYVNEDENVEYREGNGEATITVDGEAVYENCEVTRDAEDGTTAMIDSELLENGWQWAETRYEEKENVTPTNPSEFVLTFQKDGRFSATTDCNNVFGAYEADENEGDIEFSKIAATKKACAGETQEAAFANMLEDANAYIFAADGSLVITLDGVDGTMTFQSVQ